MAITAEASRTSYWHNYFKGGFLQNQYYGLLAFLIPLGIRAIPELLAGQYPIGFDTIGFYVPNTLDWANGRTNWGVIVGSPPLMYAITIPAYAILRISPVLIFKILGPALYGCMSWSLFRFLRFGLGISPKHSLGTTLLTASYFVTLRIGWDLYRNMLGLTFILLGLPLLSNLASRRSRLLAAVFLLLAVLSDQFTAILALSLIGGRVLVSLRKHKLDELKRALVVMTPSIAFLSLISVLDINLGLAFIHNQLPLSSDIEIVSGAEFLIYAYLPLLPLVANGLRKLDSLDLKNWMIACAIGAITVLVPFFGLIASFRWSPLMDLPLCMYASFGIPKFSLRSLALAQKTVGRITFSVVAIFLVVSATAYIVSPAQHSSSYYDAFPSLMPTSMMQSTIPSSDYNNMMACLDWLSNSYTRTTFVIAHQAIYGWIRAYVPIWQNNLINYGYASPLVGAGEASKLHASTILLIWWANGSGWHNQPFVPNEFVPVSTFGDLVLYKYSPVETQ